VHCQSPPGEWNKITYERMPFIFQLPQYAYLLWFFFKYLSSGTSAGLLFALLIIHLMKAVFWLNKIYCKNV
jgi:hypothetical protein